MGAKVIIYFQMTNTIGKKKSLYLRLQLVR